MHSGSSSGAGARARRRYETLAWIHIAGLTVFAVFAAWWLIGALQSRRELGPDTRAAAPTVAPATPVAQRERRRAVLRHRRPRHGPQPGRHLPRAPPARRHQGDRVHQGRRRHRARRARRRRAAARREDPPARHEHAVPARDPGRADPPRRAGLPGAEARARPAAVRRRRRHRREPAPRAAARGSRRRGHPRTRSPRAWPRSSASPRRLRATPELRGPRSLAATCGRLRVPPATRITVRLRRRPRPGRSGSRRSALAARALLDAAPRTAPVVGHFDWRSENIPVVGARVVAVFDWDSVGAATEPIVVGSATHHFTLDWRAPIAARPDPRRGARLRRRLRDGPRPAVHRRPNGSRPAPPTSSARPTAPAASTCWRRAASRAPTGFRDRLASAGAALLG